MKASIYLGIFFLLIISFISIVDSSCTSDCNKDCSSVCATECRTNCRSPCRGKCNTADCRNKCDIKEPEVPEVQNMKETLVVRPADSGSKTSNVNDIRNDYNFDINPNITMTNTITNVNNISVPINVTSANFNNIRVSSSDSRSTQTNITASGGGECSGRNPPTDCRKNQKQIVIIPYPQRSQPQILPPPQTRVVVQPIVREPIIIPAPTLPPQRIPVIVPTPIIQQNPISVQPQPTIIHQPIPQYYWFSQQYIRQPQQTVITQPQQQLFYAPQNVPCGAPGGQCGSYCLNQPCSTQSQPIAPMNMNYPVPSSPCQRGDCGSRMMYALTRPYIPGNQLAQYEGINSIYSRYTPPEYGGIRPLDMKVGLPQVGAYFDQRNGLPQYTDVSSRSVNHLPIAVDSYFIPDQFSRYQIQGGNMTEFHRKSE